MKKVSKIFAQEKRKSEERDKKEVSVRCSHDYLVDHLKPVMNMMD